MAVAIDRSMNAELREGATDAALKKPRPDTGQVGYDATAAARRRLMQGWGGYDYTDAGEQYVRDIVKGVVRGA